MSTEDINILDMGILSDIAYSDYEGDFIQNLVINKLPISNNGKKEFFLSTAYTLLD